MELPLPYLSQFLTVAFVHLLAVASPGPDFAIVVRQSVSNGRTAAVWTSIGVGLGILLHVGYSLCGVGLIVSQSPQVFSWLKVCGAAYLLYLGIQSMRAGRIRTGDKMVSETVRPTLGKALLTGFLTNGLNPKATLFFVALFTVGISPATPWLIQLGYGLYMAVATALWFVMVSMFFGQKAVRRLFFTHGHWFERLMGAILVMLALRLLLASP